MADDRDISEQDITLDPEDVNSPPSSPASSAAPNSGSPGASEVDPNDEVPVPIAMSPAEVDERAQAVEALRGTPATPRDDTRLEG